MPKRSPSNRPGADGVARVDSARSVDGVDAVGHVTELTSFAALSSLLWSERECIDQALYKLTTQRLLLASGDTRWLAKATDDVQKALEQISATEVLRAAELEALAESLHLPSDTTLAELAAVAPEPWTTLLGEHRDALRELVTDLEALGTEVRTLLRAGLGAIRETLDSLDRLGGFAGLSAPTAADSGYDASGSTVRRSRGPILLDETL